MQIDLDVFNGTSVFVSPDDNPVFTRIHGHVLLKDKGRYIFPAYPPFGNLVLSDMNKVLKNHVLSDAAQRQAQYLANISQLVQDRVLPQHFSFHSKPFEHQVEALVHLYHHPRYALFADPGVGKTKVLIDLIRLLKETEGKRALVLGPRVVVRNWAAEAKKHAGDTLKVGVLDGDTKKKRKVIAEYKKYDVIVCSYGTARTLGLPRLNKKTLDLILEARKAGRSISDDGVKALAHGVRKLVDPERQAAHVLAWAFGMPAAQVVRYAEAEAATNPQWLEDVDYGIIVADESHNIKDMTSQQTKTVLALSKQAGRRYLLTGTPSLGKPQDLFPQMKFLSPNIIPEDWMRFKDMFLVTSPYNKHMVTGYKNLNILNGRVQRVAIRKTKEECLDLPARMIIDVPFQLSEEQKRLYNTLVTQMGADLRAWFTDAQAGTLNVQNAAVLLNKLSQVTSGFIMASDKDENICNGCPHLARCVTENIRPYTKACKKIDEEPETMVSWLKENPKMEVLEDLLEEILREETNKVIIWGIHTAELNAIQALADKLELGYVRVDGKAGGNLQKRVDRFNDDPKCRLYIGQIATGVGITLNAATYTIYSSLDWSLATYLQSIDRNYRAGQTKKTTVYRLIGEGTVDEYKLQALDAKKDISSMLTNKLSCVTCEKRFDCLKKGVELYDEGCIHKRNVKRTIAKAEVI